MQSVMQLVISAALLMAAPLAAAVPEGTWTATEKEGERLQLTLQWGSSTWGRPISRSELRGLSDPAIGSSAAAPVSFRIEREAGVFELEGFFREGRGAGHFRFHPNREFAGTLRSFGIGGSEEITDRDLMKLAISGLSSATVRELAALGFDSLTVRNLIELAIHDVTPEYVRAMRSLGLAATGSVRDLVAMRIHDVTVDYVREMEALGYGGLSREQLVRMRIHDVDPGLVRELQALGYRGLSAKQLVKMRIHDVTPAFIRRVRAAGVRNLAPETLIRMRIHDIDPESLRGSARAGG